MLPSSLPHAPQPATAAYYPPVHGHILLRTAKQDMPVKPQIAFFQIKKVQFASPDNLQHAFIFKNLV